MPIGAHVGVSAGYGRAVEYAASVGCECIQVFSKSPRQWNARPMDVQCAEEFRSRVQTTGMAGVLVHTSYLINLGSDDDGLWERSSAALADELVRADMLGADGVVTHVGTRYRSDPAFTATRIAAGVDRAFAEAGSSATRLLLENTAAAGTTFGDGPEELGAILALLGTSEGRVGVCLDTCHAHAAGWDLSVPGALTALVDDFERCCGMPIEAIHANDCLHAAGMHKDRHAWIGEGTIGYAGFSEIFEDYRLRGLPVITEMPGEVPLKDAENVSRLKRLRDACAEPA
ncbi:MAG: deoxyribonuclease IV [Coriobacteriia bacterium]|nr:deoxyribonuclease IV [Coriobacteriia bacterium]